jgi:hypothetical protein
MGQIIFCLLLTKVDPRMPAAARESIAVGVTCKHATRYSNKLKIEHITMI